MITLIHGPKGSGKTKKIIDMANAAGETDAGAVVYITDQPKHSVSVKHSVRFIDSAEYQINCPCSTLGFIKGILSGNNDITKVYIDGLARMCSSDITEMKDIYAELECLSEADKCDFFLTVSADKLPAYLKKYV